VFCVSEVLLGDGGRASRLALQGELSGTFGGVLSDDVALSSALTLRPRCAGVRW